MDRSSNEWDGVENLARWRRLGELGLEAGLREGGCADEAIANFCRLNLCEHIQLPSPYFPHRSSSGDQAAFLAVLGRANATVRSLEFYSESRTGNEVAALCANLASNTNIQNLKLWGNKMLGTVKGCTLLGNALRTNSTVQVLCLSEVQMGSSAVKFLLDALLEKETLLSLDLSRNPLSDEGTKAVAEFLKMNRSLKTLNINGVGFGFEGAKHISSALETNTTLEEISLGGPNPLERGAFKTLLRPFSRSEMHKNTTLRVLRLVAEDFPISVEELVWMIKLNKSLSTLQLERAKLVPKDWTDIIFTALKANKTLRKLLVNGCQGLAGQEVEDALLQLLQSNETRLTELNLWATDLHGSQGRVNEELRKNNEYRIKLHDQALVQGKAKSGRLILCGFGYAGKTSICKTMEAIERGFPWSYSLNTLWTKAMQNIPGLQRLMSHNDTYREANGRTRGFDVVSLKQQQYLKFIWDFAGQNAYYALHDYLFPQAKNSCFLYVCSCRCPPSPEDRKGAIKSQEALKSECEYWMKFIASNSEPHSKNLPRVRFVLTKKDTLSSRQLRVSQQWAQQVVRELAIVFKDVLQLCETLEVVDSRSLEDVSRLLTLTDESLKEVLEHQTEYALCEKVRSALAEQSVDSPVMSCEDFFSISGDSFSFEDSPKEIREAILAYFNDLGEVIFPKGFDFLVTNPRWFGVGVLGFLIDSFRGVEAGEQPACTRLCGRPIESFPGLLHRNGIVDRRDVKVLLKESLHLTHLQQRISSEKLIDLMIHLELCFESQPGKVDSPLFLPALFDDDQEAAAKGKRQLEWKLEQKGPLHYLGRRLECQNKATTFLTPGFFPRLQVHLHNYIHQNDWTENRGFAVDRNLICFAHNGVEALVEYSGDIDYFIDILVRSSKPPEEALKFKDDHVVRKIQDFCALQKGCQGVILIEAVIRKVCVEELHLCKDRKAHSVLVSTLKAELEKDMHYKHTWSHPIGDQEDTDYALELLDAESPHQYPAQSPEIPSFRASSISNPSEQFPTLFYPSIENIGMLDRLNSRLNLAKKMPVKLHLMCDHKDGHHVLDGQPGRPIELLRKGGAAYDVPILKLAVTLLWTGVGVASSIGGASIAVPIVDGWIQNLFNVREMPDVNGEILHAMMSRGTSSKPVSEQDVLKALERYWRLDPQSQGVKHVLDVQDGAAFWNDFQLRKVVYTEARHRDKIGWVCDRHYWPGLKKGLLHSV